MWNTTKVNLDLYKVKANLYTNSHVNISKDDKEKSGLSWIVCLTSQLTIFQSYMWRHTDVQADRRRSMTYGRAPNAIDIFVGFFNVPVLAPTRDQPFYTVIPTHRPI